MNAGTSVARLRFRNAGRSSVQDLGRYAGSSFGFGVGGAADQYAAECANAAIGNDPGVPLIELTASTLSFASDVDVLVCVTGAVATLKIDGVEHEMWEPVVVPGGAIVEVGYPTRGARVYLAIAGEIDSPSLLGSVAPDPFIESFAGAHADGSPWLADGDTLIVRNIPRLRAHPYLVQPLVRPGVVARPPRRDPVVRVMPGPDWGSTGADAGWLFDHEFEVDNDSNAVGVRLSGTTAPLPPGGRVSRGVPIGAVEMPTGDDGLIVLLRSRLLTAGYRVPAVAATVDHDVVGQLVPGDRVSFTPTDRQSALAALADRADTIDQLLRRARTILSSL